MGPHQGSVEVSMYLILIKSIGADQRKLSSPSCLQSGVGSRCVSSALGAGSSLQPGPGRAVLRLPEQHPRGATWGASGALPLPCPRGSSGRGRLTLSFTP